MSKIKPLYNLKDLGKDAIHIVGGKAAHLGELIKRDIPIPEGFVLSTSAFERFINRSPFSHDIRRLIEKELSLKEIIPTSETLQKYILETDLSSDMHDLIIDRFEKMRTVSPENFQVAVRSSANVEDLSKTSFAGQADTFLCISREDELIESIKKCWSSVFSARAIMYIQQMVKVPLSLVSMGVIIQRMVSSEVSGVMFTANVITKDLNQILINATCGLGECVADGKVVPDSIVVDKKSLNIVKKKVGTKLKMSIKNPYEEGTILIDTPIGKQQDLCLTEEQIRDLARYGIQIENLMDGAPQDIEWAIENDLIKILQSRNITRL